MRIDSPRDYVVENLKYALDPSSIAVVGAGLAACSSGSGGSTASSAGMITLISP